MHADFGCLMLFYEPLFLFVFLPILLAMFFAVRRKPAPRLRVLLVASVLFYLWSQPLFVPLVLATCVVDYAAGRMIARGGAGRRAALVGGILINVGMLVYFKYANFTVDNFDALIKPLGLGPWHLARIALPVGVSFITFEKISYLVDIDRGKSRPAPDLQTYLLFVFLFPKLLAGPIMKYHELEAQLLAHGRNRAGDFAEGFARFMRGVVKKTLLADTLATGADTVFGMDASALGTADAWAGALFFTFQIYIDFSAYTDMAIGIARMFGFRLSENFNKPYISRSITEFWRRWHMSLTSWIRDYLYIPLGGNRVAPWRVYANLWICFLLSGLWHGAAWTYVGWGAYNGLFLVLDRLFLLRLLEGWPVLAANAATFLVTILGWVVFRAVSLTQAGVFFHAMLGLAPAGDAFQSWATTPMLVALAAAALISFLPRVAGFERAAAAVMVTGWGRTGLNAALMVLFALALAKALADPFKPFLYFRF